ncbi:VWA domain-containing protein [Ferroplasma acidiphilum]|uniref:VWA domain-containing protein n=1 Tax=Ferroplasma acidiphilum TaxID=74969 RepID=UPI00281518C8|nr:VWA domain-containing protein [Ferroplasma acidiphilum]WMT53427.1 MAG: VWA domain-containing protein [Ferroplasma acidiphilum]
MRTYPFPFSAIVDNEDIKLGLIVNAIDSNIGGLLITGPKGIAKSTMVRALSSILPEVKAVKGCRFHCDPDGDLCDECLEARKKGELKTENMKIRIINLPNSTTLDRVVGSLDISHAIKGESVLREGLIGEANRGILYIDEVNLLDDSIVDSILDSAASGINIVEREGVSYTHPARFILVGTMNPEEGELRPQLLDRFGISVEGKMPESPEKLLDIADRVEEFDSDRESFIEKFRAPDREIQLKIVNARKLLPYVKIKREYRVFVADLVIKNSLSNRAMISTVKTAKAIAAYYGRTEVNEDDLKKALQFALNHRMKEKGKSRPDYNFNDPGNNGDNTGDNQEQDSASNQPTPQDQKNHETGKNGKEKQQKQKENRESTVHNLEVDPGKKIETKKSGRSGRAKQFRHRGRKSGTYMDIRHSLLNTWSSGFRMINEKTIVMKDSYSKGSIPFIIAIDSSRSMNFSSRIEIAREFSDMLLKKLYIMRSRVALIKFAGERSEVLMNFSRNFTALKNIIDNISSGGKTPLYDALENIYKLSSYEKLKTVSLLVTDGRGNVFPGNARENLMEISKKIKPLSSMYIIDKNDNKFLPTYNGIISSYAGAKIINNIENIKIN